MTQRIPSRQKCHLCGRVMRLDFVVPDEVWQEAIPPGIRDAIVCFECFAARADEKLIEWNRGLRLIPNTLRDQLALQCEHGHNVEILGGGGA